LKNQELKELVMLLIRHGIQQLETFFMRRAKELERFLAPFGSFKKAARCFNVIPLILVSNCRPMQSRHQLAICPKKKKLKNRNGATIPKSDTSFCALFQRISIIDGEACLSIHRGVITLT
jgi:hypothetical protein